MNKYEPKGLWGSGHRAAEYNQHVSRQSSTTKNADSHWEESRSGTSNRGQAGEWAVSALRDKLVIFSYLCWKNTNGNLDIFFRERGWVLDVWVERRCSGYNLIKSNYFYNHDSESEWRTNGRTSEQSMSSDTFCPRSWSLVMAALKELVARAWLSIYSNLYIRFNVPIE